MRHKKSKYERQEGGDDEEGTETELFVGNLAYSSDENALRNRFKKYGTITNIKIPQKNGRPSGIAFM